MKMSKIVGAALAAALVLACSAALGVWLTRDGLVAQVDRDADAAVADADAVPDNLVRQNQPIYYTIDPPIVVNLHNGGILQIGVSLSTHYASVNEALKNDDPALRSAILLSVSDVDADTAEIDGTKQQLLAGIVKAVNHQIAEDGYKGAVDAAYFTSFVIDADG
jgi:flagellar FliL protein